MADTPDTPRLLIDVLRPLQRELNSQRTLSLGKLGILRHLAETDRATTGELATRIQVSPQGVSLATRELEELGLIERTRDDDDRRKVWFVITDAGRSRREVELRAGEGWLATAIETKLTAAEAKALAKAIPALGKLTEGLHG